MRKVAETGSTDPFEARVLLSILNIRDYIFFQDSEERHKFDELYSPVHQNLSEAKFAKDKCLSSMKQLSEGTHDGSLASYENGVIQADYLLYQDINLYFKDFFIRGVIATQTLSYVAKHLGYKLHFLFSSDDKFEEKYKDFIFHNTDPRFKSFFEKIKKERENWYNVFDDYRGAIEHKGYQLPEIKYILDKNNKVIAVFPKLGNYQIDELLELLWGNIWRMCEEVIVFLLSLKLRKELEIAIIPVEKRDPKSPIKFVVQLKKQYSS